MIIVTKKYERIKNTGVYSGRRSLFIFANPLLFFLGSCHNNTDHGKWLWGAFLSLLSKWPSKPHKLLWSTFSPKLLPRQFASSSSYPLLSAFPSFFFHDPLPRVRRTWLFSPLYNELGGRDLFFPDRSAEKKVSSAKSRWCIFSSSLSLSNAKRMGMTWPLLPTERHSKKLAE